MSDLAKMYSMWTLNSIQLIAHALSVDFVRRPIFYKSIRDGKTIDLLRDFRAKTGRDPMWPGRHERIRINRAILGKSDHRPALNDGSRFHARVMSLLIAAVKIQTYGKNEGLMQGFEVAAAYLQQFLRECDCSSLASTYPGLENYFESAVRLLKKEEVAASFGALRIRDANWPFIDAADSEAARLMQVMTARVPSVIGVIDYGSFMAVHQRAIYGTNTINLLLRQNINYDKLAVSSYQWFVSLLQR